MVIERESVCATRQGLFKERVYVNYLKQMCYKKINIIMGQTYCLNCPMGGTETFYKNDNYNLI